MGQKFLLPFRLITSPGVLPNAGAIFAEDCSLWQSRLYCIRLDGNDKNDVINDAEFTVNNLLLSREVKNFVKSITKKGWEKLAYGRENEPEYAKRAALEVITNHFIHLNYTMMGEEAHLDICEERFIAVSSGVMFEGMLFQDIDINEVST